MGVEMIPAATGRKESHLQPPEGRCCLEASTAAPKGACASRAMEVRTEGVIFVLLEHHVACTPLWPVLWRWLTCVHVLQPEMLTLRQHIR